MILLDTHSWLWWLSDPRLLSQAARKAVVSKDEKICAYRHVRSIW